MKGLRLGAVVFLDALGFKGIWNRTDPRVVLAQLKRLKRQGLELQGRDRLGVLNDGDILLHRVRCISDTILIAATIRDSHSRGYPERPIFHAMTSASLIASSMIHFALDGFPPFLFRGCLAVGLMNIDGNFLIGPAIDEAAELFEKADGPFFWMASSALRVNDKYTDTFLQRIEPTLMVRYSMPMRDGTTTKTLVYNYGGLTKRPDQWALTRDKVYHAFGDSELRPEVERKRHNALEFLNHVQRLVATSHSKQPTSLRLPFLEDLTLNQKLSIIKNAGPKALLSLASPELQKKLSASRARNAVGALSPRRSRRS